MAFMIAVGLGFAALILKPEPTGSGQTKAESGHAAHAEGESESPGKAGAEDVHAETDKPENPETTDERIAMDAHRIEAAGIVLARAEPSVIRRQVTLPGEIKFNEDRTAHVVPRVAGIVESVSAQLGQTVRKGQTLAVLSSVAVSDLRSESQTAQRRLALARTTYEREKKLWQDRISAEQDYLQAQQQFEEARIAASNASQKLKAIDAAGSGDLARYVLRAPMDGVVVGKHLAAGESVTEDATVFTVSDLRTVWAEIGVPASELALVKVGTPVTVAAAAFDSVAEGQVSYVGALLGEQTRTATARVSLPNPDGAWRPGLFVNVGVTASEDRVPVTVLTRAIQRVEGNDTSVFIPVEGGFTALPIRVGRSDGERTEVLEGLPPGQAYVGEGSFMLKAEQGKSSAEHAH